MIKYIIEVINTGKGVITTLTPANLLPIVLPETPPPTPVIPTLQETINASPVLTADNVIQSIESSLKFTTTYGVFEMLPISRSTPVIASTTLGHSIGNPVAEISLKYYSDRTVFTDAAYSKGLEYAGDYTGNFTDNSLITKKYVDLNKGMFPRQVIQLDVDEVFFLANFDVTGLGINLMLGMAWCNGNNGTIDHRGNTLVAWSNTGQPLGSTIGSATTTLTEANMPSLVIKECQNTSVGDQSVPAGSTPYFTRVDRTIGSGQSFNNIQPSSLTLFVMRLP